MKIIGCPTWESLKDYSLKEYIALTGVVAAVAGLAISFFAGTALQGIVFGTLLVVTIACFYYMRKFDDLDDLAKTSGALRKTQNAFTAAQKRWDAANKELQEESSRLKSSVAQLQKTTDALNQDNQALRQTERALRAVEERMRQDNTRLQEANTRLQATLAALRTVLTGLHVKVDQFNAENSRLSHSLGIFTAGVSAFRDQEAAFDATLHGLDQALHQDTARLSEAIRGGQAMSVRFMAALKDQTQRLEQDISRLSQLVQQGHFSEERLAELGGLIRRAEEESSGKRDQLERITAELRTMQQHTAGDQAAMSALREGLAREAGRLEEKQQELRTLEERYRKVLEAFQKIVPLLQAGVSRVEH